MKKILIALTLIVTAAFTYASANSSSISVATEQDHCPANTICLATNMTAKGYDGASGKDISGISVYRINGTLVAKVPGHGTLKLYWSTAGKEGWHFDANDGIYVILKLGKNI